MELKELSDLLRNAVSGGAANVPGAKACQPYLSKSAAYKIYGRSNVDRWLAESLIKTTNKKFDRAKLEAIAALSNRVTYLPVAER